MNQSWLDEMLEGELDLGPLINNYDEVKALQRAVSLTPQNQDILQQSFAVVLRGDAWARRYNPYTKEFFLYRWESEAERREQFLTFVSDRPERGLGTTPETLLRLLEGTPEYWDALALLGREPGSSEGGNNPEGRNQHTPEAEEVNRDIVTVNLTPPPSPRQGGNSNAYAAARLGRERPDLLERVKAGEMSANAAMVEAGFRKVPTPLDVLRKAWQKASATEQQEFVGEHAQALLALLRHLGHESP